MKTSIIAVEFNSVRRPCEALICSIAYFIQFTQMRWYGHVMRREDENSMKVS